ncbi:hypothetical protein ACTXT7_005627 [Hymenolepis weldensis]
MIIEVQHLDATILYLKADKTYRDICKVLLFLRRDEQIWINTEVDFGQGKVLCIPVSLELDW